jgi:hypothetical protein
MNRALPKQSWWIRPQVVFLTLAIALVVVMTLAANIETVRGWLGASDTMPAPRMLTLQVGKMTRIDMHSVTAELSYKKVGADALEDCRFWMDAGTLQLPAKIPTFTLARGSSDKDLTTVFDLGVLRAKLSPTVSIMMSCDAASSEPVRLDVRKIATSQP